MILDSIVENGFLFSCVGVLSEQNCENRKDQITAWKQDAKLFADIGLEISKTLFDYGHPRAREWKEKSTDPVAFFLRNHKPRVKKVDLQ